MKITYEAIGSPCHLDGDNQVTWGLAAYSGTSLKKDRCTVAVIHDITTDLQALVALAEKCNCLSLSVIHLKEVVEDFLIK